MSTKKAASGAGSIRKKTVTGKDGKKREYWEGRVTLADGTRKSVSDQTQAGCLQKMKDIQREVDSGTYVKPSKLTVSQWLDMWLEDYCTSVKPRTLIEYESTVENHFKPTIGKIKLSELNTMQVQRMCNNLKNQRTGEPLSPKRVKDIHGMLHKALQVAERLNLISKNPADNIERPKVKQAGIKPLDNEQVAMFISAIQGHRFKDLFMVAIFTGMRESELCGLSWDAVNFKDGTITVKQQIQRTKNTNGKFVVVSTKNDKNRIIRPATAVMQILKDRRKIQLSDKLMAGEAWNNEYNLVFTEKEGRYYIPHVVYENFKRIAKQIGCPDARFHDLRHTFATLAISNGDDIKTVQENLGHYAASFTLQVYGHVTEDMKRASAERMNKYIQAVTA